MTIPAIPIDPVTAIIEAFEAHDVVALCDGGHGCEQAYALRVALIFDPRFAETVNDIVVESGNALYQSMMDRFISGEDVPEGDICKAWQNTMQPHDVWDRPVYEGLLRHVCDLNKTLPDGRRIRVLLGDPPMDWERVSNAAEFHEVWNAVEDRDSHAAKIIQREVLDKRRRALVIYGGMHFLRKQLAWQSKDGRPAKLQCIPFQDSIVSLLEAQGADVFSVWCAAFFDMSTLQADIRSWQAPSLASIRGTPLGETSFRSYYPHAMFTTQDGAIAETYVDPVRSPVMEEQFDAVVYLGPPSTLTWSQVSPALAGNANYLRMRADRLEWVGLPL